MTLDTEQLEQAYESFEHRIGGIYTEQSFKVGHRGSMIDLKTAIQAVYNSGYEVQEIDYYALEENAIIVYGEDPPQPDVNEKSILALRVENGNDEISRDTDDVSGSNISVPSGAIGFARANGYQLTSVKGFSEEGYAPSVSYTFTKVEDESETSETQTA